MIESNTMVGTGMKVVCQRDELTQKLGVVSRAVSTRASVQILSGVLLRAEAGRLHLAATDMELSLRSSLDAQTEGEGAVVVPGRLLVDLVRLLPADEVTLEHRFEQGKLVMAATDSYRLSVKETSLDGDVPELEAIIPARALAELGRIAHSGETVELGVQENQIVFAADDVWLTTRRIDGQFPNYRQLLPDSFEHDVTLPRVELLDIVRRVGVVVQRTSPIQLRFSEGELGVFAQTQDVGEARESLPTQFSGEPLQIGFNAEFLREGIESIGADEIRLRLISPLRPAVIEGGPDDPTYLIMPIRLPG